MSSFPLKIVLLKENNIINDQQGNARVSFQNNGSGAPIVKQENSYYAFGMIMPNSPVATPATPNKNLYNAGSEWQNDYGNLPDYYQTFNRNYDAAIGIFIGVDPSAESAESMTPYQYAGNNPVMNNDPLGDIIKPHYGSPRYIPYTYEFGQGFVDNGLIGSYGPLTGGGVPTDLQGSYATNGGGGNSNAAAGDYNPDGTVNWSLYFSNTDTQALLATLWARTPGNGGSYSKRDSNGD